MIFFSYDDNPCFIHKYNIVIYLISEAAKVIQTGCEGVLRENLNYLIRPALHYRIMSLHYFLTNFFTR